MKKLNILQRSPEWEQLRKTHLTGTVLKGLMGTARARQEAIYEAIANRLTVGVASDEEYENPMARGTRLEPDGIAEFEFQTGKSVEQVGMCENDENPVIAQSPDGYIKDTKDTEAIELKSMGGKNHVKLWLTDEVPSEYKWQVVQYFVVNDKLKKLYFVGYNPQIPVHPLHIIEVLRKNVEDNIEEARIAQIEFIKEVDDIMSTLIKI